MQEKLRDVRSALVLAVVVMVLIMLLRNRLENTQRGRRQEIEQDAQKHE